MKERHVVSVYNNEYYNPCEPIYREIVNCDGIAMSYMGTSSAVIRILEKCTDKFIKTLRVREYSGAEMYCEVKHFAEHDAKWFLDSYNKKGQKE